jgi:hypothetical protein
MVKSVTEELTVALQRATDDAIALLGIDHRSRLASPAAHSARIDNELRETNSRDED